jgi:hypothetical protein
MNLQDYEDSATKINHKKRPHKDFLLGSPSTFIFLLYWGGKTHVIFNAITQHSALELPLASCTAYSNPSASDDLTV